MQWYHQRILQCIERLSPLVQQALQAVTHTLMVTRGAYLLQQGNVCQHSYTIKSGVARKFHHTTEREVTTAFYFADDIAVAFHSYVAQMPSQESMQALTDVTAQSIAYTDFERLKGLHPELLQLDLLLTEYYAAEMEQRLFRHYALDATARYQQLVAEHPQVVQQVQLTYVASYLGISLETLSRIRAKR